MRQAMQSAEGGKMKLKNFLVVEDAKRSRKFYQELFGLEMLSDNGGNMVLSEGLSSFQSVRRECHR